MADPEDPPWQPMPKVPLATGQAVILLGGGLLISFGTINHAYAIMAGAIADELGITEPLFFSVLSVAMLISGFAGPAMGRLVDRRLAIAVMSAGSAMAGILYLGMGLAPSFWVLGALMVVLQVVSLAVLYGAAFPAVTRFSIQKARGAITHLTLIGGLAPTLFWPITGWLMAQCGWRITFLIFALLHLLIVLPLHLYILRRTPAAVRIVNQPTPPVSPAVGLSPRLAFWLMAASFGITSILSTTLIVHLIPILMAIDLGPHTFLISMLVGPTMVLSRLALSVFWPDISPLRVAIIALVAFLAALACLAANLPTLVAGIAFVLFYGCAHGLNVISNGTLPLQLFGAEGYGEVLGRLHLVRVLLGAGAPAAFSFALAMTDIGTIAIAGMAMVGAGLVPLLILGHLASRAHD